MERLAAVHDLEAGQLVLAREELHHLARLLQLEGDTLVVGRGLEGEHALAPQRGGAVGSQQLAQLYEADLVDVVMGI